MSIISVAKQVFENQSEALKSASERLDETFESAIQLILNTNGRVIVSGMGKSGIIGRKIAATLASTGTPSFFVHPAEAYHGDLGMFTASDIAILISYSGETEEVIRLIPSLRHFGTKIIAFTGKKNSTLALNSDLVLDVSIESEACPNNLAPTTSTTVTLAMGDAIAVALINERQFKPKDFAVFHPGGSLGRRLLTKVKDLMHVTVPENKCFDNMRDVIVSMTQGGLGLTIVSEAGRIKGVITDGDLRRSMFSDDGFMQLTAEKLMSKNPVVILEDAMFSEAEQLMLDRNINCLVVVDADAKLKGVVRLLDIKKLV